MHYATVRIYSKVHANVLGMTFATCVRACALPFPVGAPAGTRTPTPARERKRGNEGGRGRTRGLLLRAHARRSIRRAGDFGADTGTFGRSLCKSRFTRIGMNGCGANTEHTHAHYGRAGFGANKNYTSKHMSKYKNTSVEEVTYLPGWGSKRETSSEDVSLFLGG